jgi:hypothetical protein
LLAKDAQAFFSTPYSDLMRLLLALKSVDVMACAIALAPNNILAANANAPNLATGFFMNIPLS